MYDPSNVHHDMARIMFDHAWENDRAAHVRYDKGFVDDPEYDRQLGTRDGLIEATVHMLLAAEGLNHSQIMAAAQTAEGLIYETLDGVRDKPDVGRVFVETVLDVACQLS